MKLTLCMVVLVIGALAFGGTVMRQGSDVLYWYDADTGRQIGVTSEMWTSCPPVGTLVAMDGARWVVTHVEMKLERTEGGPAMCTGYVVYLTRGTKKMKLPRHGALEWPDTQPTTQKAGP